MADELASFLVMLGADPRVFDAALDRAVQQSERKAEEAGRRWVAGLRGAVADRLSGGGLGGVLLGDSIVGSAALGGSLAIGRGLLDTARFASQAASEINYYRRTLVSLAGDAGIAESALKDMQDIAAKTPYDTAGLLGLGVRIAGRTGNVAGLKTEIQELVDFAAAAGVRPQNFLGPNGFQRNFSQLLAQGDRKVAVDELSEIEVQAPQLRAALAKARGIGIKDASKLIDSATGNQLLSYFDEIARANRGAGERAGLSDPQSVLANIRGNLSDAAAPTGNILNAVATPLLVKVNQLASSFRSLNEVTSGGAGLVIGIGAAVVAVRLGIIAFNTMRNTVATTIGAITTLTGAIQRLGAVAATTTVTGGVAGGGGGTGSSGGNSKSGGVGGFVGNGASSSANLVAIRDGGAGVQAARLANLIIGGGKDPAAQATKEQTQATKELTATMKDAQGGAIGGGARTRSTVSLLEMEYAAMALTRHAAGFS